jgi:hypothetical protein
MIGARLSLAILPVSLAAVIAGRRGSAGGPRRSARAGRHWSESFQVDCAAIAGAQVASSPPLGISRRSAAKAMPPTTSGSQKRITR